MQFRAWVGVMLSLVVLSAHSGTGTAVSASTLLSTDDAAVQATLYPKMKLLTGPVLVVKYTDPATFTRADAYDGDGFIVVIYKGSEDLRDMTSPMLIENLSTVQTISDVNVFTQWDPLKTGKLSAQTIQKARLALVYYNFNGYTLVRDMVNYGVNGLLYDPKTQQIKLILGASQLGKYLRGGVVNFSALTPPVVKAGVTPVSAAPVTGIPAPNAY